MMIVVDGGFIHENLKWRNKMYVADFNIVWTML